jgi:GntR family transcriptional repressor for pyruvate dehydrogenase complex
VTDPDGRQAEEARGEPRGTGRRRYMAVVEEILASISAGSLGAGDRLPNERDLAVAFETSRPTVRDALLALELFGVVEIRGGSGCYVTSRAVRPPSLTLALFDSSPRELIEARSHVEPIVAGLCAGRLGPAEIEQLNVLIDRSEEVQRQSAGDGFDRFFRSSQDFHAVLATHCGNSILADMTRQLVDVAAHPLWTALNGVGMRTAESRDLQASEHRRVLAAIAAGDEWEATQAMSDHLGRISEGLFGGGRVHGTISRRRPRPR